MKVDAPIVDGRQTLAVHMSLITAMVIWGLNVTVVKELTLSFDTAMVAALRMLVAVAILSAIVLWKRCFVLDMNWSQVRALLMAGVLMVYLNQLFFAEGLQRTTATNGALIMALSPLVSALLAALMFRESLSARRLLGVVLGFGGVAAVVFSHPGSGLTRASTGDLLMVAGVISFAAGGALVQRLARSMNPIMISWAIYLLGTVLLLVQVVVATPVLTLEVMFPGWWPWALILFSGVMATALSNLLWNRAIATIGVARTAVYLYWVPVFGVLFAAILLDERLTGWHLVGFVAVMAGTFLGTRPQVAAARSDP